MCARISTGQREVTRDKTFLVLIATPLWNIFFLLPGLSSVRSQVKTFCLGFVLNFAGFVHDVDQGVCMGSRNWVVFTVLDQL